MSLYRNLLGQSLKITWRNKYLLFFGLFAALLGNGGQYELLVNGLNGEIGKSVFSGWQSFKETGLFSAQTFSNLIEVAREDTAALIMVLFVSLIILAIAGFLIWLSAVSQAALVNNASIHIANKKSGDFKIGMVAGINKFWPVFGLNIVMRIAIILSLLLIGTPVIFLTSKLGSVAAGIIYALVFAGFMAIALAVSFIMKYAIGFVIIEEDKFFESIRSGWRLFKENWLVSMEMALILFLVGLGVSIAYLFAILILFTPFLLIGVLLSKITVFGYVIVLMIAFLFYLAALLVTGAVLSTFQTVSWTALFLQLLNKGGTSKIVRVVSGLVK